MGRRRAALIGTRLSRAQVQAVAEHYAEHRDEVDADAADAASLAVPQRER